MAVTKYWDSATSSWKTAGTINANIYVGDTAPTDPTIKTWLDTSAEGYNSPDIEARIEEHDEDTDAHSDIRSSLNTVVSNTCNGLLKLVNTGVDDDGTYTFSLEQGGYIVLSSHPYGGRGLYLVSAYPAQSSITPVVSASTITSFTASGLSFTVSTSGNTRLWALRLGGL